MECRQFRRKAKVDPLFLPTPRSLAILSDPRPRIQRPATGAEQIGPNTRANALASDPPMVKDKTTRENADPEKVGEVDDARYPDTQTPPRLLCEVNFGESIFYPQIEID